MAYALTLLLETGVVAVVTALALALAVWLGGPITRPTQALVVGAIAGAWIHLAFELVGANRMYCSTGAACSRVSA